MTMIQAGATRMFCFAVLLISISTTMTLYTSCPFDSYYANGSCHECPPGFTGINCSRVCPSGIYGPRCVQICQCFTTQMCDYRKGCIPDCPPGFHDFNCSSTCPSGYYGYRCAEVCRCHAREICDHRIGCIPDCPPGFHDFNCSSTCPSGYYGYRCAEVCRCNVREICDYRIGCILGKDQHIIFVVISIVTGSVCLLLVVALIGTCMKLKRQRRRPQRGETTQNEMEVIDNRTLYSGVNSGDDDDDDDDKPYVTIE